MLLITTQQVNPYFRKLAQDIPQEKMYVIWGRSFKATKMEISSLNKE